MFLHLRQLSLGTCFVSFFLVTDVFSRTTYCSARIRQPSCSYWPVCVRGRSLSFMVCLTGRREHITPVLRELHWPPVRQWISFKVLVLTYQVLHATAPQYMADLLSWCQPTRSLRSSVVVRTILTVLKKL